MADRSVLRRIIFCTAALALAVATFYLFRDADTAAPQDTKNAATVSCPFDVHWPLRIESDNEDSSARPLLLGQLIVCPDTTDPDRPCLRIRLELARPDDEVHRQYWNQCLAYRQYRWMDRVRVWDEDRQWLYPNLAYLFKLHGIDRLRRYGGWDPGHQVDNDFGALLIRKFDATGSLEESATWASPLVSAEWHVVDTDPADRQTVAHRARSDEFTIFLPTTEDAQQGRLKVWFVYADFMGHPAPSEWPEQPELNGGSMAFFHVDWQNRAGREVKATITQQTPPPTGFDWQTWVGRPTESDNPEGRPKRQG